MVDSRETTGGLEADPGGAPVSTAAFSGHGGGLSTELRAEIDPTKMLGAGKGLICSRCGPRRRKSVKSPAAKEGLDGWYGSERGEYEPTQADTRGGRLARGEPTEADEVDADGVRTGKVVASGAVGFGGRLREAGKEVGVAVGRTLAVI